MKTKYSLLAGVALLALPALAVFRPVGHTGLYGELTSRGEKQAAVKTAGADKAPAGKQQRSVGFAGNAEDAEKYGQLTELFGEDFSLCAQGTEDAPDMQTILNIDGTDPRFEYPWNNMDPQYYHGDHRWGIEGARPAGGCIAFVLNEGNPQGHVVTPVWDYKSTGGSFVVEFRARVDRAEAPLHRILVEVAETNNWAPSWDIFDQGISFEDISNEWTTYRVIFQNGGPTSLVNIVGEIGERADCTILVDDVKVYSLTPYVATPVLTGHSDFQGNSFNVNWNPVEGAEKYEVSVWNRDEYGQVFQYVVENKETTETTMKIEDVNPNDIYWYDVRAVAGERKSLLPLPVEVFDIMTPTGIVSTAHEDGITFTSEVDPVEAAYGYNFTAMRERVAEADGPFVVTDEQFTGWAHPGLEPDQLDPDGTPIFTIEEPYDQCSSLYYPLDIKQQGWHGENFMTYKNFLCIDSYFWEMSREQCGWISPEFDLSKDGGNIDISMKLAAQRSDLYDEQGRPAGYAYAHCIVALFNWNDELGDYEQVESVIAGDLTEEWADRSVKLTKGSKRSVIGFFAAGSFDNLYVDDIKIQQNYKQGEVFYDPFYYRTWQLAETEFKNNPAKFTYTVPSYASGKPVYARAQAARIHFDERGSYDGEKLSGFTELTKVGTSTDYSGIKLVTEEKGRGTAAVCDGMLTVQNPDCERVLLCSLDGKVVVLGNAQTITRKIDSGVFVVRVGEKHIKLINK